MKGWLSALMSPPSPKSGGDSYRDLLNENMAKLFLVQGQGGVYVLRRFIIKTNAKQHREFGHYSPKYAGIRTTAPHTSGLNRAQ